ncbi:MAG: DUF3365 domain-containing protein [Pseudanabaenaceae cyanobacterium bins.68]|nr:DUF3365 domain-containing protein [Pseudanabaenaceae cyanobacterium bins.68]
MLAPLTDFSTMFANFTLTRKISSLLILTLLIGLVTSGFSLSEILKQRAEVEVTAKAELLLATMLSVRDYTSEQINPQLASQNQTGQKFLPQTVPSYSAHKVFEKLTSNPVFAQYSYKEAALDPTNPKDKANSFEASLIAQFRQSPTQTELNGYRSDDRSIFYIARPIKITKSSCLQCHSVPEVAPKSMINTYGAQNGFNWQLGQIIGTQVIYVPSSSIFNTTISSLLLVLGAIFAAFGIALFTINSLIKRSIIRPLNRMIKVANEVSQGNMGVDFPVLNTNDEIGTLAKAFTRMKRSLVTSIDLLKNQ